MTLSSKANLVISGVETRADIDLSVPRDPLNRDYTQTLTDGVAINQANLRYHDKLTVGAAGTVVLDLTDGTLLDVFRKPLVFVKVKQIIIFNAAPVANPGDIITLGGGAAPLVNWVGDGTDTVRVYPQAWNAFHNPTLAGWAVTATTADQLVITEVGGVNSVDFEIIIVGTDA